MACFFFLRLDLSIGQTAFAKAALQERVPFWGLALSEGHAKKAEVTLTDYLLCEMRREGSHHFRPECVQALEMDEDQEKGNSAAAKPKGNKSGTKPKKGGKKPTGKKNTGQETGEANGEEGQDEEEGAEPLKKKRRGNQDEDQNGEEEQGSPLPW